MPENTKPVEAPSRIFPDMKPAVEGVRDASKKVGEAAMKIGAAADRLDASVQKKAMLDGVVLGVVACLVLFVLVSILRGK